MRQELKRYDNLRDYCEATGKKKGFVAKELGVEPFYFTELLYPDRYRPRVSVDLAVKIANLLNQPVSRVVEIYRRVA